VIAIPLLVALLLGAPQDSNAPSDNSSHVTLQTKAALPSNQPTAEQIEEMKQRAEETRLRHEPERQEAIRINDLAANLHSEADARKLIDAVAEQITHQKHLFWTAQNIRHRVARAEYEAVADPSGRIPEDRIVNVWNEYVREIDAPEEALITEAEFHYFRRTQLWITTNVRWKRDLDQSVWTMPNIYARGGEGELAEGCRALEALKLIDEMHERFGNLLVARERLAKGLPAPDLAKSVASDSTQKPLSLAAPAQGRLVASSHLGISAHPDLIRPAVYRYQQEHGDKAYDQLLRRLFDDLFPAE
jgi:hypothetical protein